MCGRGGDRVDPGGGRLGDERERGRLVAGAVVDPRQHVGVEVDHATGSGARGEAPDRPREHPADRPVALQRPASQCGVVAVQRPSDRPEHGERGEAGERPPPARPGSRRRARAASRPPPPRRRARARCPARSAPHAMSSGACSRAGEPPGSGSRPSAGPRRWRSPRRARPTAGSAAARARRRPPSRVSCTASRNRSRAEREQQRLGGGEQRHDQQRAEHHEQHGPRAGELVAVGERDQRRPGHRRARDDRWGQEQRAAASPASTRNARGASPRRRSASPPPASSRARSPRARARARPPMANAIE